MRRTQGRFWTGSKRRGRREGKTGARRGSAGAAGARERGEKGLRGVSGAAETRKPKQECDAVSARVRKAEKDCADMGSAGAWERERRGVAARVLTEKNNFILFILPKGAKGELFHGESYPQEYGVYNHRGA